MNRDLREEVKTSSLFLSAALTKEFITPDTLLYHGTTGTFNKFDLKAPRNGTTPEDEVSAVFFSTDRYKAWTHAKRKSRVDGEEPRIITAKVKFKSLFDATDAVKKLQKKIKNFGQAKRQIYSQADKTKYDGIEFRGDNVNDPEFCFFRPEQIHIQEDKKMEANDRKLGKSLEEQGHSIVVMYRAVGTNVTEFFDKDYVTLSKKFAIEHAEHNAVVQSEQQHVIKKVVMGKHVFDAYNPGEFFYSGPTVKGKVVYKTDNEMEAMVTPKYLTKQQMIEQGAGGHLDRAVKCLVPLAKLDGLEPVPAASENNPYVKGKKITNPIEVVYDKLNDVFIVYAGNHRIEQARLNGDKHIPAFVQPDGGKLGLKHLKMEASVKPTILKNPPINKLKALIKNAQYNELKGLVSGPDVYWWNQVEDWHHHHQYEKIGKGEDPTDPFMKNPTFNKDRLVMMYVNNNPNEIALVNNDGETPGGAKYILNHARLRKLIAEGDLWIDNPDVPFDKNNINYIRGVEYMNTHNIVAADFNEIICWIDADGKQIEVTGTDSTHAATFRRLCTNDPGLKARFDETFPSPNQNNIYLFATRDLGWIRVSGHGRYFSAMVTKNKTAPRAVSALSKLLKSEYEYDDFTLDYYDPYDRGDFKQFYKLSDLITEMRKTMSKELTASYAGTGEYGYWLHDGKIGEVEHQQHDIYLRKHFNDKKLGGDPWIHGFKEGWIRAVNERQGILNVEMWYGFVSRNSFKALSELINKRNAYKGFIVEVSRGQGKTLLPEHLRGRYFMFKEGEERKVLHLVRQCLKDDEMTASDDEPYGPTDEIINNYRSFLLTKKQIKMEASNKANCRYRSFIKSLI